MSEPLAEVGVTRRRKCSVFRSKERSSPLDPQAEGQQFRLPPPKTGLSGDGPILPERNLPHATDVGLWSAGSRLAVSDDMPAKPPFTCALDGLHGVPARAL